MTGQHEYEAHEWAAIRRQRMLDDLAHVVEVCNCLWPVRRYRNLHGHDPACPIAAEREKP